MRRTLAVLLFILAGSVCFAQTDNTFYAKHFQGTTVGSKVAIAMTACSNDATIPCYIIIDPSLAAFPNGTMPTLCSQCYLIDYRTNPFTGGSGPGYISGSGSSGYLPAWTGSHSQGNSHWLDNGTNLVPSLPIYQPSLIQPLIAAVGGNSCILFAANGGNCTVGYASNGLNLYAANQVNIGAGNQNFPILRVSPASMYFQGISEFFSLPIAFSYDPCEVIGGRCEYTPSSTGAQFLNGSEAFTSVAFSGGNVTFTMSGSPPANQVVYAGMPLTISSTLACLDGEYTANSGVTSTTFSVVAPDGCSGSGSGTVYGTVLGSDWMDTAGVRHLSKSYVGNTGYDYSCIGPGCAAGGTVTSFAAPSGSWPSWLVPTVTNPTASPSLAVAAATIPPSAGGTGTATAPTSGQLPVGQGSGSYAPETVSQDVSLASNGAATVAGLKGVPFCSGFTPTNGQTLEYTTASSPNPCYGGLNSFINPMTTTGDLIVGGAGGIPTRLAAGANTYVLTSNGPGTAPTFQPSTSGPSDYVNITNLVSASGCTITSTPPYSCNTTAPAGPITLSSIPSGYTSIQINWNGVCTQGIATASMLVTVNGDGTAGHYGYTFNGINASTNTASSVAGISSAQIGTISCASVPAGSAGTGTVLIPFYGGSTYFKKLYFKSDAGADPAGVTTAFYIYTLDGIASWYGTPAAVTSLTFNPGGYLMNGSFVIYGIP